MSLKNCTTHIGARKGQIAKRVLMPGDPKRAEWVAHKFLTNAKLVNDVRGMLGFTGKYKNVPVTVMAHGMGIPSICIYAHELFTFYGVKAAYRIGSCGVSNAAKCNLGDVILCRSCWSDVPTKHWSRTKVDAKHRFFPTKSTNELIKKTAKKLNIDLKEKNAISSTFFYNSASVETVTKLTNSSVYEMEGFGLFLEGKTHKANTACLLTVSDNIETHEEMSPLARQTTFVDMVELALESIIREKV